MICQLLDCRRYARGMSPRLRTKSLAILQRTGVSTIYQGIGNHFRQHFLYFRPLPHGHGSLRPTLPLTLTEATGLAGLLSVKNLRAMASISAFGSHFESRFRPNLKDA